MSVKVRGDDAACQSQQPAAVAPAPLLLFPVNCVQPRPLAYQTLLADARGGGWSEPSESLRSATAVIYCLVPIPHGTTTSVEGGEGDMTNACSSGKQVSPAGRSESVLAAQTAVACDAATC